MATRIRRRPAPPEPHVPNFHELMENLKYTISVAERSRRELKMLLASDGLDPSYKRTALTLHNLKIDKFNQASQDFSNYLNS